MEYKTCSKCKVSKLVGEFFNDKTKKDCLAYYCKKCCKEYRLANKEKRAEYLLANKEKLAKQQKEYRLANKEKIAEINKEYYLSNKENIDKKKKEWVLANKEKLYENRKEYKLANKEKIAKYQKEHIASLPDSYVLSSIKNQTQFPPNAEIPAELIEAKRLEIKIKRLLKEMKK